MQKEWQPSLIRGSSSANRPIILKQDRFVIIVLRFGCCTLKIGKTIAFSMRSINYTNQVKPTHFTVEQLHGICDHFPSFWSTITKFQDNNDKLTPQRGTGLFALDEPQFKDCCHNLCIIHWQPSCLAEVIKCKISLKCSKLKVVLAVLSKNLITEPLHGLLGSQENGV